MSMSNSSDLFFRGRSGQTFHVVDFKIARDAAFEESCEKHHKDKVPVADLDEHQSTDSWVDHFGSEVSNETELNFDHA